MDPLRMSVGILVIAAIAGGVVWLRVREAVASARRREAMVKRIGIDPALIALYDLGTRAIGKDVRRWCRQCRREDLCARWLRGAVKGSNAFCPNAKTFDRLSDAGAHTAVGEKVA